MMITKAKQVLAGIAALAALSLGGVAVAGAADGGAPESENDAGAQAKACANAKPFPIDPNASNINYDDETGECTLDSGGTDEE